jgi:type IV secretory pathway component VirB8
VCSFVAVFRLIVVLFCVMCVICLLCLIVLPLPPGKNPFAVKINNNKKIISFKGVFMYRVAY